MRQTTVYERTDSFPFTFRGKPLKWTLDTPTNALVLCKCGWNVFLVSPCILYRFFFLLARNLCQPCLQGKAQNLLLSVLYFFSGNENNPLKQHDCKYFVFCQYFVYYYFVVLLLFCIEEPSSCPVKWYSLCLPQKANKFSFSPLSMW